LRCSRQEKRACDWDLSKMPEIEILPSSDEEDNVLEEEEEEVEVQPAEKPTENIFIEKIHPANLGDTKIPERHLETYVNHPGSVRLVEKNGVRANELKEEGNNLFKRKQYLEAIDVYTEALEYAPETETFKANKAIFLNNRAACLLHLDRTEDALDDCSDAIELDPRYIKAYMRRAKIYEEMDQLDDALTDLNKVVEIDPSFRTGVLEQKRVDAAVKEKNEKLKEEMMGKLKDLGNTVLGKFGLSLDNFKAVQDPSTGSYSISFQQ